MKMKLTKMTFAAVVVALSVAFVQAVTNYTADVKKSTIKWEGKKIVGGGHDGKINIKSGKLALDGKVLKGGEFVIDMNSMTCDDLTDAEYNGKLIGHLKSDDFFGTDKHPEAKFIIKSVTAKGDDKYDVKGDLTIKGKTNSVEFPATVKVNGNTVTANAAISVDRSKFDVKYGSGSFFDNLGDKAIDDIFTLNVSLVANK